MQTRYQIGDLVHIPQSARLLDCDLEEDQLVIPLGVIEINQPKLGVVTHTLRSGYVQIYCEGSRWSVEARSVYKL